MPTAGPHRPMRILHLCPGQDTGGQAIGLRTVWGRVFPEDEVRVVTASTSYPDYPVDLRWRWAAVSDLYAWADVVHLHNHPSTYAKLDLGARKPIVLQWHGTRFRSAPAERWAEAEAIGATVVVSTVDLLDSVPAGGKATWLPQVVDMERLAAIRAASYRDDGRIRIAHAPTDRVVKSTAAVVDAVRQLGRRYPVELVLVERQPHERCLRMKAAADIYVDQFGLGYGNNAIEAWAMGQPVVAGATPTILARMRREYRRKSLPFVEATPDTLYERLEELVTSADARTEAAARGAAHVTRFHAPEAAARRLRALYEATGSSAGGPTRAEAAAEASRAALERRRVPRWMRRRMEREARARGAIA